MNAHYLIAGVDEAGRGPLAGPVTAAAVILDPGLPIQGVADSKKLSAGARETLELEIKDKALAWSIGLAEAEEIDRVNILQASLLAMARAVAGLSPAPTQALVDGIHCPILGCPARAVVKGDVIVPVISAASILAKVVRDREMHRLDLVYPEYGFARHKGYPTQRHRDALRRFGPCAIHRRSFGPVRELSP